MAIGRPRKPTKLHLINGNPSKLDLDERLRKEPQPRPSIPKWPTWLNKHAKKEWKRVVPMLDELGLLTEIDMAALAAYCQSYARWKQAEELVEEHGLTYVHTNKGGEDNDTARPEVAIAHKYLDKVKAFATEFGLTPSSRTRIEVPKNETTNEMERLLMEE